jgi:hypothetical protein
MSVQSVFQHALRVAASLVVATVLSPTPADADPIHYSFSGTWTRLSTMDLGYGLIDISLAAFTVTGTTIGDQSTYPDDPYFGAFAATSTYDFGALGTFTTDYGGDHFFVQRGVSSSGVPVILEVGLESWILGLGHGEVGFSVSISPVPLPPELAPLGTLEPLGVRVSHERTFTNAGGQTLYLRGETGGPPSTQPQITSASVEAVPEPQTIWLLALGAGFGWIAPARRRSVSVSRSSPLHRSFYNSSSEVL